MQELDSIVAWIKQAHDKNAIAKAAGLHPTTVKAIGEGAYMPRVSTLVKLAKVKATPAPRAPQPPPAW